MHSSSTRTRMTSSAKKSCKSSSKISSNIILDLEGPEDLDLVAVVRMDLDVVQGVALELMAPARAGRPATKLRGVDARTIVVRVSARASLTNSSRRLHNVDAVGFYHEGVAELAGGALRGHWLMAVIPSGS